MKEQKWTDRACPRCGSPDRVVNPAWLRGQRVASDLTLRDFAKRLGFSAPYISDVERGLRHCTPAILKHYEAL